jgi:hypothetical protein
VKGLVDKFVIEHLELGKNVARKVSGLVNIVIHLDVKPIHNQYPLKIIIFEKL